MAKNQHLIVLTEGALITAAAQVLNFVPHSAGISSIQFQYGLIPMAIFALRRGLKPGLMAGLCWGLLDLILRGFSSGSFLNPLQGFIEYPVAFAAVGLIGLGSIKVKQVIKDGKNSIGWILLFSSIGFVIKYFCHFVAGGVFWGAFAPKTMNPWIYSLVINGGSFIANMIMLFVLLIVLHKLFDRLIIVR
ncbi:energy-coupled thiamine transporter ThiT [Companilactobacillus mishanensis]|uniref:Energy-coupled thiamine transporter ThiT n=1 Tax=Companilactobacillus mishanensis TaxID=2486008 RepID=A0A5P0ZGX6_9LACO|nr:energy-coupled thiamine transporter ThiT [Companilactobacillus mishanensis]MQS44043.1 energy-coupled thiamine transporter ThiT [Companilactobacillus mishanensis]MQS52252.1 energy-coupled thiamine transporter ThiT [Companilactobacillus mishanensis]MQS88342.1 energy-coupled thiamine transporter ThiT [Companilactobacillus mishanensis]